MIFVNLTGGMPGIPWWAQHAKPEQDLYTFVDIVFPAFLFMVGTAIPFSLGPRLDAGAGWWGTLARILPRTFGLVLLGIIFVNDERFSAELTGMPYHIWSGIALLAAITLWSSAPADAGRRRAHAVLQAVAAVVMAWMLVIWRAKPGEGSAYLEPQWWGILGMIGWAYLVAGVVYLLVRGDETALMGVFGLALCVYIGSRHDRLGVLNHLDRWLSVGSFLGSTTAIVLAGVVAGSRLRSGRHGAPWFLLWFGLGLWAAGWFLRPLHGYSKDNGTESWALVTAGITALLLLGFHLALDRGKPGGKLPLPWVSNWLVLAGRNALLAYILPDLVGSFCRMVGVDLVPYWERGGGIGALNAAVISVFVVSIAALATRVRYTVRL
jgi:predicted acyltransferase